MKLIIDTNQAAPIIHHSESLGDPTIVIPPLVWAEIVLSPDHRREERLDGLAKQDILFGMDIPFVYQRLAVLAESEITTFEPIFSQNSNEHEALSHGFGNPSADAIQRAKYLRESASADASNLAARLRSYRKQYRDAKSRNEDIVAETPFRDISEAEQRLIWRNNSPVGKALWTGVSDNGTREVQVDCPVAFCRAAFANCFLIRFFRLAITFDLGYCNLWEDEQLNCIDLTENRNDFTDIALPLYARDGDVILTADGYLRRAIRHTDPDQELSIQTVEEYLSTTR